MYFTALKCFKLTELHLTVLFKQTNKKERIQTFSGGITIINLQLSNKQKCVLKYNNFKPHTPSNERMQKGNMTSIYIYKAIKRALVGNMASIYAMQGNKKSTGCSTMLL